MIFERGNFHNVIDQHILNEVKQWKNIILIMVHITNTSKFTSMPLHAISVEVDMPLHAISVEVDM
jgi:hypothetical protein